MFGRFRFRSALVFGVVTTALSASALGEPTLVKGQPELERNFDRDETSSTDATVPLTINRADCHNTALEYTFNVTVQNYSTSYSLEVWAGTGRCDDKVNGSTSTQPCWKLRDNLKVKNQVVQDAVFTAQELLGLESTGESLFPDCESSDSAGSRQEFNVYFMFTNSGSVQGQALTFPIYYDLVGPEAPGDVRVQSAESALKVTWDPLEDEEGDVSYRFYCKANPSGDDSSCNVDASALGGGRDTSNGGSAGTSGNSGGSAGTSSNSGGGGGTSSSSGGGAGGSDGGTAGTGSPGGTSGATTRARGTSAVGDLDGWFRCGTEHGISTKQGYAKGDLSNRTSYAVVVVPVDQYENEGTPSEVQCMSPEEVDTFFEHYRNQGGKGGGGFCSFRQAQTSLGSSALLLLSLGAVARIRRRPKAAHCQPVAHL